MRYLLIALAAFMLLALPAFGHTATDAQVTVNVTVPEICIFTMTSPVDFPGFDPETCEAQDVYADFNYYINSNMTGTVTASFPGFYASGSTTPEANLSLALENATPAWKAPADWGWTLAAGGNGNYHWHGQAHMVWWVAPGAYSGVCTFTCAWS